MGIASFNQKSANTCSISDTALRWIQRRTKTASLSLKNPLSIEGNEFTNNEYVIPQVCIYKKWEHEMFAAWPEFLDGSNIVFVAER